MAVKEIIKMGHPLLNQVAAPVRQFNTPELTALVADMRDTMIANNGAGLAAPQIGIGLRVVIFGVQLNPRYPDAESVPETILINPEIEPLQTTQVLGWEGCLSVPGLRGQVPRYLSIRYRGHDQYGVLFEREAEGFHARVVQHEVDHLNGVLYPRRMVDLGSLGYEETLLQQGILKFPLPDD